MSGLHDKYDVKRRHDDTGKHDTCRYFVLDPQHDPAARGALREYAYQVRYTDPRLADDLRTWLYVIEEDQ